VAVIFMSLAALPFVRFVQVAAGSAKPLLQDSQVRLFFAIAGLLVAVMVGVRVLGDGTLTEASFRAALFNSVSVLTGTGYASTDYMQWGPLAIVILFFAGLVGGCAGSTSCSIKVFRYQLLFAAIVTQIRQIHSPHGVFAIRYEGRRVSDEVLSSVMAFFVIFVVSIGLLSVLLGLTGLDFTTSLSGAATALANVGPGLGDIIGPAGSFAPLNDTAKWLLAAGMLVGRLELMVVYALFTIQFWRN
jgi:trk system potassium uptake protein TrkH